MIFDKQESMLRAPINRYRPPQFKSESESYWHARSKCFMIYCFGLYNLLIVATVSLILRYNIFYFADHLKMVPRPNLKNRSQNLDFGGKFSKRKWLKSLKFRRGFTQRFLFKKSGIFDRNRWFLIKFYDFWEKSMTISDYFGVFLIILYYFGQFRTILDYFGLFQHPGRP